MSAWSVPANKLRLNTATASGRDLLLDLLAQPLVSLLDLRRKLAAEVRGFKHLPNLHLSAPVKRSALQPLDRLFLRLHLPQPEACDQFLAFGERPVNHCPLLSLEPHASAFRARLEPFPCQHHSSLYQL